MQRAKGSLIRVRAVVSAVNIGLLDRLRKQLLQLQRNFENAIALDTVRNEYLLHSQIHEWFIEAETIDNVDSLNERVYSTLFLTPSADPWLGLFPTGTYTGLENGGISQ